MPYELLSNFLVTERDFQSGGKSGKAASGKAKGKTRL